MRLPVAAGAEGRVVPFRAPSSACDPAGAPGAPTPRRRRPRRELGPAAADRRRADVRRPVHRRRALVAWRRGRPPARPMVRAARAVRPPGRRRRGARRRSDATLRAVGPRLD